MAASGAPLSTVMRPGAEYGFPELKPRTIM